MPEANGNIAIEFQDVTYRSPEGRALISHLYLQVLRGETLVLLGRSGSGKTTTLQLIYEPFGALDPLTRNDIQKEFKSLQQRLNKTVVFVTHDVTEAMLLGTRIALMDEGRLLGVYSPPDFLRSPDPVVSGYVAVLRAGLEIAQMHKVGLCACWIFCAL